MKKIIKIFIILIILGSVNPSNAQDRDRPWYIGIGLNAVDFYPNGEGEYPLSWEPKPFSQELFSEFFAVKEHYNISPLALRLSIGRYVAKNISFEFSVALNQISNFGDLEVDDLGYFALDGAIIYSFRNHIDPTGWADPFIGVGGGITWVEEDRTREFLGTGNLDLSIGFGVWISERVSIVYKTIYKYIGYDHELKDFTDSHFQHSLGVKYIFNFEIRGNNCYNFK